MTICPNCSNFMVMIDHEKVQCVVCQLVLKKETADEVFEAKRRIYAPA
jgi:DNA-directed RNA polymerase subunit M/transcription elongation factor TFIIS